MPTNQDSFTITPAMLAPAWVKPTVSFFTGTGKANSTDAYLPATIAEYAGARGGVSAAVTTDPNYTFAIAAEGPAVECNATLSRHQCGKLKNMSLGSLQQANYKTGQPLTEHQQKHLVRLDEAAELLLAYMHEAEGSALPGQYQEHVFMSAACSGRLIASRRCCFWPGRRRWNEPLYVKTGTAI